MVTVDLSSVCFYICCIKFMFYYYFPSCHAQVNSSGKVTCSKFNRQLIEGQEQNNIQIEHMWKILECFLMTLKNVQQYKHKVKSIYIYIDEKIYKI